jgi:hypothetical protein
VVVPVDSWVAGEFGAYLRDRQARRGGDLVGGDGLPGGEQPVGDRQHVGEFELEPQQGREMAGIGVDVCRGAVGMCAGYWAWSRSCLSRGVGHGGAAAASG